MHRVVEKPDATRAEQMLAAGNYLWNTGIFVWTAKTILAEIEDCAPELHRALTPRPALVDVRPELPPRSALLLGELVDPVADGGQVRVAFPESEYARGRLLAERGA